LVCFGWKAVMSDCRPEPVTAASRFRPVRAVAIGFALGVAINLIVIVVAVASAGAGHGHYGVARALFPAPLLLTPFEGDRIGPLSLTVGLFQFPIYGGVLLWSVAQQKYRLAIVVAWVHLFAILVCFSGGLPNFS
jgi:hypothetical protein